MEDETRGVEVVSYVMPIEASCVAMSLGEGDVARAVV
jgi:hypothetical protein